MNNAQKYSWMANKIAVLKARTHAAHSRLDSILKESASGPDANDVHVPTTAWPVKPKSKKGKKTAFDLESNVTVLNPS
jgi:hypothetical protein